MTGGLTAQVWERHAGRLVGRRIERLCIAPDTDIGPLPGFELDDGTTVWVLEDPEGNGSGFLEFENA